MDHFEGRIWEKIIGFMNKKSLLNLAAVNRSMRRIILNEMDPCEDCYRNNFICFKRKCLNGCTICISNSTCIETNITFNRQNISKLARHNKVYVCDNCMYCQRCRNPFNFHYDHDFFVLEYHACKLCSSKFCRSIGCFKYVSVGKCYECSRSYCQKCSLKCLKCGNHVCISCLKNKSCDKCRHNFDSDLKNCCNILPSKKIEI